ncbi:MAG TPA: FHA domain-containing protein [Casimicrobiaceae bacterium]|nr:FHA domain-containing protein [Casimicrobiaceae bacterium]
MAKLVLSSGGSVVQQCFVDRERLTIGRDTHNAIVIDDPAVSREHAAVVPVGNDHILEDLRSANGTFVNGSRVPRRILQHGDVIEFGAFHLRYLNPRTSSEIDLERTMLIEGLTARVSTARDALASATREIPVAAARPGRNNFPIGRVTILAGADAGCVVELDRVVATFGQPGIQVAVITRRPQGYFVTHVEGRRYPVVNGIALGRESHPLRDGDRIEVGDQTLELRVDAKGTDAR